MSMLFYLGIMLLGGLLFGRLAKKVGLPNVTGYLVAGLIVGPYVLKIIPADAASSISMVSEMALGFIALSIGAEFKLSYFREVGVRPVVIAILEGLCAMGAVVCGLLFAGQTLAFSLVLGAIASATAPAATIMVIRQYNANGPLTKTLLSVVALDDAVALIAFGFAVTVAKTLNSGSGGGDDDPASLFQKNLEQAVRGLRRGVPLLGGGGFLRRVLASLLHDIRRAPCEHIEGCGRRVPHRRYGDPSGVHAVLRRVGRAA